MNDQTPAPTAADLPPGEYGIAELLGHSTMTGRCVEAERFGTKMLQIEPIWQDALLPAVYVGGTSLYRFTPCTREVAFRSQARDRCQLPPAVRATLPPPEEPKQIRHYDDEDIDFDEDGEAILP